MRIGIGYDAHRLIEGRPLFLGGIEVPHEKGLLGHSDGDVLIHAVCDAILGAAGEEDIGTHFPDTDESIRGIASGKILSSVLRLVVEKGFSIIQIDTVVAAEEPKIKPFRRAIRQNLGRILQLPPEMVGVKGKTTEGLGFVGNREGIEAYAVALLQEPDNL
jgi:2-C-methyl-D-erythritol 2,4-cyclodiphosphate synthase